MSRMIVDDKMSHCILFVDSTRKRSIALLQKKWTNYKLTQYKQEESHIKRVFWHQQQALQELRAESEELYQQALEVRGHANLQVQTESHETEITQETRGS